MSWCPGSSAVPARWDLSIVLKGLSDAPFGVSLREAFLESRRFASSCLDSANGLVRVQIAP